MWPLQVSQEVPNSTQWCPPRAEWNKNSPPPTAPSFRATANCITWRGAAAVAAFRPTEGAWCSPPQGPKPGPSRRQVGIDSFFPPFHAWRQNTKIECLVSLCSYYWVRWDEETESEMDALMGVEWRALVSSFRVNLLMKVCVRLQNRFSFVLVWAHGNRKATAFLHCRAIR